MAGPLRVGLIGVGRWGQVYLRTLAALSERCRLTHLGTSRPEHARLVPYPVAVLNDWRKLIASDCEAVIVATPPQTHAEIVEACLEAGKPCLVEKPLCLDPATAERLRERIRISGVPVLVDHTHLFSPAYRALKQALAEGREAVRVVLSEGMAFGPFRTHTATLWDWGPHDVSLCLDLVGHPPDGVDALAGPCSPEGDAEMVSVRLEFADGPTAWIQLGRLSVDKRRRLTVITDRRLYLLDDAAADTLTVAPWPFAGRYTERTPEALAQSPLKVPADAPTMVHVVSYFLDGLGGGDRSRFGAELAVEVVRVLAACEEVLKRQQNRQDGR